jgi:hypothetical protein
MRDSVKEMRKGVVIQKEAFHSTTNCGKSNDLAGNLGYYRWVRLLGMNNNAEK